MKEGMLEIGDQVHFRKRKGGTVSYGTVVAIQYVIKTHDGRTAANVELCSKYANTMSPRSKAGRNEWKIRRAAKRGFFSRLIGFFKKEELS